MRALVAAGWLAVAAGATLAGFAACDDTVRSHVYTGRLYEPARGCLDDLTSVDVVAGPEPESPCAPICFESLPDDAGDTLVYVSSMCAPYPAYPYTSNVTNDPRCTAALALFQGDTTCEADGSVLNPPVDAAGDVDASAPDSAGPVEASIAEAGAGQGDGPSE